MCSFNPGLASIYRPLVYGSLVSQEKLVKETLLNRLKRRARSIKTETYAIYIAYRDPRVPWFARLIAGIVLAYALSPIDLIPDFIPILGYLDDLLLVPLGILLVLKMIPEAVMQEARLQAQETIDQNLPVSKAAVAIIIVIWILLAVVLLIWLYKFFYPL